MTVTTKTVSSGYSTGTINENFQTLEDYINNNLLNRDGTSTGEVNQLELSLDMNSNFIFNLPEPTLEHQAARLKDVQNAINGADQANLITFTPYGNISSENVQGAIQELVDGTGQSVTTSTGEQALTGALDGRVVRVNSISEMLSLDASLLNDGQAVYVNADNDPQGGMLTWDASSTATEDLGAVFQISGVATGRFIRAPKDVTAFSYGIENSASVSQSSKIEAYIAHQVANRLPIDLSPVDCLITGEISIPTSTLPQTIKIYGGKFTSGTDFSDQATFLIEGENDSVVWDGLKADGGRDTKTATEQWTVFATQNGIDSIQPTNAPALILTAATVRNKGLIEFKNGEFTNFHAERVIRINSDGETRFTNNIWKNCSNKSWIVTNNQTTGEGTCVSSGESFFDIGILSDSFDVDGVSQDFSTTDYMPQGAFNALCTFGTFYASNMFVDGYGSTGITADRNKLFLFSNIDIRCNNAKAMSNNPSGGFWDESCTRSVGSNVNVEINSRDSRDAGDNSCIQIYKESGEHFYGSNMHGTDNTNSLSRVWRLSTGASVVIKVNNASARSGDGSVNALVHGTTSGVASILDLESFELRGNTVIRDCNNVLITGGSRTTLDYENVNNASRTGDILINGGKSSGITTVTDARKCKVSDIMATRRVEIQDVEIIDVGLNTLQTDQSESIVWINPSTTGIVLRAFVHDNMTRIVSGTSGAGHVTFNGNVDAGAQVDQGNDKGTY